MDLRRSGVWGIVLQCIAGSIAIALLTLICFHLQLSLTVVAFLYLIIVVLLSAFGGFVPSMLISIVAVLCLDYFFATPLFSLELNNAQDVIALVAFLTIASVIARLVTLRERSEDALRASEQRHRADQAEQALYQAQMELAHVTRVVTLGELMASIAHEINQPLAGVVTNGQAALRWLARDPPNLEEVRVATERVVRDGNRASDIILRVRALARKADTQKTALDINDVVQEAILFVRRELQSRGVNLHTQFAPALPTVVGDRIQLQQVLINLIVNGVEAMDTVTDRQREMLIQSRSDGPKQVLIAVKDSGVGINPDDANRLFSAFYTTKSRGMGMGLSISRSIILAHGGQLSASPNSDYGATFQFTLPTSTDGLS